MTHKIPKNLPIAASVEAYLESLGWTFTWDRPNGPDELIFRTHFSHTDHTYPMFLETKESKDLFEIFIYMPFDVPIPRMSVCITLINRLNGGLPFGRYYLNDLNGPKRIQWRAALDVEGVGLLRRQIEILQSVGARAVTQDIGLLGRAAFTAEDTETLWTEEMARRSGTPDSSIKEESAIPAEL